MMLKGLAMSPVPSAFKRITTMPTDELRAYCENLRAQVRAKQSKVNRLKGDLARQGNILAQAERELQRRSDSSGYHGR